MITNLLSPLPLQVASSILKSLNVGRDWDASGLQGRGFERVGHRFSFLDILDDNIMPPKP